MSEADGWRRGRLGDFLLLKRGFDITVAEQKDGGIPVVSSSGVTSSHNKAMVKGPGVVIGRKGRLGNSYYIDTDFWPHDTSLWVSDFKGNDPRFIAYFLKWLRLQRLDAATSVPTLNRNSVHPIYVSMPSASEQRRIVEILYTVDRLIGSSAAVSAKLRLRRTGLVRSLLAELTEPEQSLIDFLADRPRNGFSPKEVESWTGVAVLGLGCLTADGFSPRQVKNVPASDPRYSGSWLSDGELLITRSNTFELVGLAGRYRDVGVPCLYPDLMMKLTPKPTVRAEFLEIVLRDPVMRTQVKALAQGTSGSMVKISGSTIADLKVRIPELAKQDRILRIINAMDEGIAVREQDAAKLRLLKQGLMDDLLTGRVRVTSASL